MLDAKTGTTEWEGPILLNQALREDPASTKRKLVVLREHSASSSNWLLERLKILM